LKPEQHFEPKLRSIDVSCRYYRTFSSRAQSSHVPHTIVGYANALKARADRAAMLFAPMADEVESLLVAGPSDVFKTDRKLWKTSTGVQNRTSLPNQIWFL
jgi:hypothetical protein